MKSDTQGGEWEILQGAENFIKNECLGLELELFKYYLYENIKLESEIKEFLFDYGFRVAGWTGYKNSFLSQADYLFLKTRNLSREDKIKIDFIEKIYSPNGSDRLIKSQSLIKNLKKNKKTRNINPE